jgi:excisionase family DNA binding protein
MAETLLTSRETAEQLGVGLSTLQRWAAAGIIEPAWRTPGGHARWDIDSVRRQLGIADDRRPGLATAPEPQPVVAAIVTSPAGVLAGRRNDARPPWTFIAGEIEPGESPADAAVREVKEETGLDIRAGNLIGRRVHPATHRHMIYMSARPVGRTDIHVGDPAELAEVRWLTLAEADRLLPGMFSPVRAYLARALTARRAAS